MFQEICPNCGLRMYWAQADYCQACGYPNFVSADDEPGDDAFDDLDDFDDDEDEDED